MSEPDDDVGKRFREAQQRYEEEQKETGSDGAGTGLPPPKGNGHDPDAEHDEDNPDETPDADDPKAAQLRQLRLDIEKLTTESTDSEIDAILHRIALHFADSEITCRRLLDAIKANTKLGITILGKRLDEIIKSLRRPTPDPTGWRKHLLRDSEGIPYNTASNILRALRHAPEWQGVLGLDEFHQRPMLLSQPPWPEEWKGPRPFADADEARVLIWMQERCLPFSSITAVLQALSVAIDDNRFHPVRDYLDKLPEWDKTPRLDIWLSYYLGVEPIEHYTGPIGKCWLISAVARIYQPGCQAKYCPILEGEQDLGKSEALAILGGEWFTDDIAELGTKDAAMQVGNAWIAELSELDSVRKAHVASMKAFISRKVDRFRKPFGRHVIAQERQCVMAGTLNPGGEPFVDETGNVRFWPVLCLKIDLDALKHDRDQLWAEAVYRYKQREKWWLENEDTIRVAREQQDERLIVDSWGDVIKNYLDNHSEIKATTSTYILRDALGMHVRDHDRASQSRVGIVMRRHMKWNSRKSGSRRWFERPGEINTTYPEDPDLNKSTSPAASPKSPVSWPADFSDAEPQHTFR